MQILEPKSRILSHGRLGLKAPGKRRNIIIYWVYGFCKTLSYFFQKTVGQGQNIAVTPITTVSCMSHYPRGTSVGQDGTRSVRTGSDSDWVLLVLIIRNPVTIVPGSDKREPPVRRGELLRQNRTLCLTRQDRYTILKPQLTLFAGFMQGENILESDSPIIENSPARSRSKNTRLWILLHAVAFLLGLAALIVLILVYSDSIWISLARVGWGFLVIVGLNLTRHLLRAASMYRAVAPEHRTFKYRRAVAARFGGEAVTFFTFTGPFLGDATKAVLMRKDLPLTHGASAVIIDNILYYVSVMLVVL